MLKHLAARNLLRDGTTTSAYDALGRLTSTTHGGTMTTHAYNGNDVLIAQSSGNTTTRSTQDLVAPLSQILQLTQGTQRTDYVYGRERLLALEGTAQTWYGSDALGSVRQTLSSSGAALSKLNYDPWGMPQGGATPPVFGFTGELQDATSGLVYLRARWYQPQHGRFGSRDPFTGRQTQPASLHPYNYAWNSPAQFADPSGQDPWNVQCDTWPILKDLRGLCKRANVRVNLGQKGWKEAVDARESIDYSLAELALYYGAHKARPGFSYFFLTMRWFLDGGGAQLNIGMVDKTFAEDPGIIRATRGEGVHAAGRDEPDQIFPLLHDFLWNWVRQPAHNGQTTAKTDVWIRGDDGNHYRPRGSRPRAHDEGYWAAFGHVDIDGKFDATIRSCAEGYIVAYQATYSVTDRYQWFKGKRTPVPSPTGTFWIPHEWHISLIDDGRAHMYSYTMEWKESDRLLVTPDFTHYRRLQWWEYR